ncbi:MAG: Tim44 domain-containing protein [Desulfobacteraceae bacterium]|nr:MAG: Tim44 domain-containing protein [Desulfobacteraceae bacterium]
MVRKISIMIIGISLMAFFFDGLAEARRMGGGRSFGSRPSYQNRSVAPQKQTNQAQPQQGAAGRPGGLFGGLGGMMGGMLMGGLLGSLLFGGGMRGFGGPGLLDILVIGGGLFLLFRYLKSRRTASQEAGGMSFQGGGYQPQERSMPGSSWGGAASKEDAVTAQAIPAGFDAEDFLKGAKAAYNRLQDSWNKRDLEDIRQFTSPEVWEEINRQAMDEPAGGKTEIVLVNAKLLEVKSEGDETIASVYFDVLMRESAEEQRPKQVREVWHFSKEEAPGSFWKLEGIQQME